MPRPAFKVRVNMDDAATRRRVSGELARFLAVATGEVEISINPVKPPGMTRTARQLRFYWPMIVQPLFAWMQANGWEVVSEEDAHDELRRQLLTVPAKRDPATGRPLKYRVRRTGELDAAEFAAYVDRCRELVAKYCGIDVGDPDPQWREHKHKTPAETVSAG